MSDHDQEIALTNFWTGSGSGRENQGIVIDDSEWPVVDMEIEEHVRAETTWVV